MTDSDVKQRVYIRGTGSALASREVPNSEFEKILATSDDWIVARTGIRSRRFCDLGESSATLATEAARRALDAAQILPDEIDLIVCGTVSPERTTPPNAAVVQAALKCRHVPSFDISAACSGFMFALGIARGMMLSGTAKNALVIGAEALSRSIDFEDRNSCILFGDGAGAVVISVDDDSTRGITSFSMGADGSRGDLIQVPGGVSRTNRLSTPSTRNLNFIRLEGPETFRFAVKTMTQTLTDLHDACRFDWAEIDLIVPHQVNLRVFETVAKQLEISLEKIFINIDRFGNTAAASIPIALDEAVRSGRIVSGQSIVLVAFGGGLTWSTALIRW